MKNKIEQELQKTGLPCLAFYKMPDGEIKVSTSGLNKELYDMLISVFKQSESIYNFMDLTLDMVYELKNPTE